MKNCKWPQCNIINLNKTDIFKLIRIYSYFKAPGSKENSDRFIFEDKI